jgi:hypothetical protein
MTDHKPAIFAVLIALLTGCGENSSSATRLSEEGQKLLDAAAGASEAWIEQAEETGVASLRKLERQRKEWVESATNYSSEQAALVLQELQALSRELTPDQEVALGDFLTSAHCPDSVCADREAIDKLTEKLVEHREDMTIQLTESAEGMQSAVFSWGSEKGEELKSFVVSQTESGWSLTEQ